MPSCDHTGVPGLVGLTHFHSSTTSGSASLVSVRMRLRVLPRQSASSAIRFEMSSTADWSCVAPDFFILKSSFLPEGLAPRASSYALSRAASPARLELPGEPLRCGHQSHSSSAVRYCTDGRDQRWSLSRKIDAPDRTQSSEDQSLPDGGRSEERRVGEACR